MASVQTSSYKGRYLKLTVIEESTSIANNTSTVRWTLESIGGESLYYSIYNCKVVVNGQTVYDSGTTSYKNHVFPVTKGSTTGTITVGHKSDGSADAIGFELHGKVYASGDENKTGTLALSTIPRYLSINTFEIQSKTETTAVIKWATSDARDNTQWSIDGGNTWHGSSDYGESVASDNKSGTFNIKNLTANTSYNLKIKIKRTDSQLWTTSDTKVLQTYDYPHVSKVGTTDLVIGNTQTLTLYNPLGRSVTVKMYQNPTVYTDDISQFYSGTTTGTSLTFTPNKTKMYQTIPNNTSSNCSYSVTYGSVTKVTTGTYTYKINTNECLPVFTTFTHKDANTAVTGVTGNNQVYVKGLSILNVSIASANKMTTKNSATPNKYNVTCDSLTKDIAYSTSDISSDVGVIANSGTKRINVKAIDSRGQSVTVYQDVTVYDYAKPVINLTATRANNFEDTTTLKISGTYTRLTINNTDKNTIQSVRYRYREAGGTWGNWVTVPFTASNGNYTGTDQVLSLDNSKQFEFEVQVLDKLTSDNSSTVTVDVGIPIFMIGSNTKKCYINYQEIIMYDVVDTW